MFTSLTPMEYLKCDIICAWDKSNEKLDWSDRLKAFEEFMEIYHSLNEVTLNIIEEKASNPYGFNVAMKAYNDVLDGKPTGHLVSLDATASGLQLYSVLTGCKQSFQLCGGVKDRCVDTYTEMYIYLQEEAARLFKQMDDTIQRGDTKDAIMQAFYGSKATPKKVFGEDNLDIFFGTMPTYLPGAYELMTDLESVWDMIEGDNYSWTLPDNFDCEITTTIKETNSFSFQGEKFDFIKFNISFTLFSYNINTSFFK